MLAGVGALTLTAVVAAVTWGVAYDVRILLVGLAIPALVLLPSVLARPRLVLVGVVVVIAANLGAVVADLGVPGLTKGVILAGAVAAGLGVRRGQLVLHSSVVYLTLVCFYLAQTASLVFAHDRAAGLPGLADLVQWGVLLLVLATLASAPGGVRTLAVALASTLTVLAGLTVLNEFLLAGASDLGGLSRVPKGADVGGATGRHAGPYYDANFWGRDLVLFFPLALAWLATARSGRARATAVMAALAMLLGIYLTQSRGAYLALAVATATYLALAGRRSRRLLWGLPVVGVLATALPGVGSRLETVTQVVQALAGGGDPSLVGRVAALRLGLAMAVENPLLGVGKGNFLVVQPEYQRQDPTFAERTLAPHNLYVEFAAESGLLGLLSWLLFFGCVVVLAVGLRRRVVEGQPTPPTLPAALVAGLVGWAFASVFLHLAEFHLLLMIVALVVVLHAQSERSPTVPGPPARPGRLVRRLAAVTAAVCFVEALIPASIAVPVLRESWEVVGYATVAARNAEANPYERDVAGRSVLNATYVAIMEEQARGIARGSAGTEGPAVSVAASPTSLLLTVTAVAADRTTAAAAVESVLSASATRIDTTESFYVIRILASEARVARVSRLDLGRVAVVLGAALLVGVVACGAVLAAGGQLARPRKVNVRAAK